MDSGDPTRRPRRRFHPSARPVGQPTDRYEWGTPDKATQRIVPTRRPLSVFKAIGVGAGIAALLIGIALAGAVGSGQVVALLAPTPTFTVTSTASSTATSTTVPTATPDLDATIAAGIRVALTVQAPTNTSTARATSTAEPSNTPRPRPTDTPEPPKIVVPTVVAAAPATLSQNQSLRENHDICQLSPRLSEHYLMRASSVTIPVDPPNCGWIKARIWEKDRRDLEIGATNALGEIVYRTIKINSYPFEMIIRVPYPHRGRINIRIQNPSVYSLFTRTVSLEWLDR